MRAHPKGKTLVRKAGRPGGRKALQAPGKRRAQEQVKNVGREYKTSAFLNTYQKPYEVALTHKDMNALKPANGSRMRTKNIKLPSAPNFPRPFTHQLTRFLHSCNRSLKIPINTFSICRNCRDGIGRPSKTSWSAATAKLLLRSHAWRLMRDRSSCICTALAALDFRISWRPICRERPRRSSPCRFTSRA